MSASQKKNSEENGTKTILPAKIIANMREATGASDEDIKTMLQICNGDANLATERLLENPFSKVVSKKDKRKQKEDEKRRDREAHKPDPRQQHAERERQRHRNDRPDRGSARGYPNSKPAGRPAPARPDPTPAAPVHGSSWEGVSHQADNWPTAQDTWQSGGFSGGFESNSAPPVASPAPVTAADSAAPAWPVRATPGMKMADLFKGHQAPVEVPPPAVPSPPPAPEPEYIPPEPAPVEEPFAPEPEPLAPEPVEEPEIIPVDPPIPTPPAPSAWGVIPEPKPEPTPPAPSAWGVIPEPKPEPTPPMPTTFKNIAPPPAPEPQKETLSYPSSAPTDAPSPADALQLSFGNFNLGGRSATDGLPGFKPISNPIIPTAAAPIPVPSAHPTHAPHTSHTSHAPHTSHAAHAQHMPQPTHTSHAPHVSHAQHASHAPHASHNIVGEPVPVSAPLSTELEAYTAAASTFPSYLSNTQQSTGMDKLQPTAHPYTHPLHLSGNTAVQQHFQPLSAAARVPGPPPHVQPSPPTGSSLGVKFGTGFGADKLEQAPPPPPAAAPSYNRGFGSGFGQDANASAGYAPASAADFGIGSDPKPAASAPSQLTSSNTSANSASGVQPLLSAMGYQLPSVEAGGAVAATSQAAAAVSQTPLSQQAAAYPGTQAPPGMQYPNYYPNFYPPSMYSYAHYSQGGYPQQTSTSYPQAAAAAYNTQAALGVGGHRNFSAAQAAATSYPTTASSYGEDASHNTYSSRDREVAPGYSSGTPLNAAAASFPPPQLRGGPYFQGTAGYLQQPYAQQYYGGHNQYNQFPSQQGLGGSNQSGPGLKLS